MGDEYLVALLLVEDGHETDAEDIDDDGDVVAALVPYHA